MLLGRWRRAHETARIRATGCGETHLSRIPRAHRAGAMRVLAVRIASGGGSIAPAGQSVIRGPEHQVPDTGRPRTVGEAVVIARWCGAGSLKTARPANAARLIRFQPCARWLDGAHRCDGPMQPVAWAELASGSRRGATRRISRSSRARTRGQPGEPAEAIGELGGEPRRPDVAAGPEAAARAPATPSRRPTLPPPRGRRKKRSGWTRPPAVRCRPLAA